MVPCFGLNDYFSLLIILLFLHIPNLSKNELSELIVGKVRLRMKLFLAIVERIENDAEAGPMNVEQRNIDVNIGNLA